MINRNTGNKALDLNTIDLDDRLKLLEALALLGYRIITGVALANATDVDIRHRLGRAWKGWLVIDTTGATAAGRIDGTTATYDRTTFLRLRATGYGATITVALLVF